tara:strand:- start:1563 stop:2165 length:603 start_codon:yes stop_codon:yes gene_type:complete
MTVSINGTDLISLAGYKTRAGISSSSEDSKLEAIIDSVSQLVKTYCGVSFVDFYSQPKTEYISNMYSTHLIPLTESPVRNIQSVKERSSPTHEYKVLSENSDYVLDSTTDSLFRVEGTGYASWASGPNSVQVTYTAGYEALPKDLVLAVVDLIAYYHKNEQKARQTIAGATLQNNSTTSRSDHIGFPDHIKRILDLYKVL